MRIRLFFLSIFIEICVVVFLGFNIRKKLKFSSQTTNVNIINKKSVVFSADKNLDNFYSLKPNYSDIQSYLWLPHKTVQSYNKEGFNDLKDYNITKPINTYRIIALGDSYTFGAFVDTKENWTELLESKLNNMKCNNFSKFEIINLGVSGYDIQFAAHRFVMDGAIYQPDLILWFLKNDDFLEIRNLTSQIKNQYIKDHQQEWKNNPLKINTDAYRLGEQLLLNRYKEADIIDYQISALNSINKIYNKQVLVFDYFPLDNKILPQLNNFIKNQKFWSFDYEPTNKLNQDYNRLYSFYPNDSHPNQEGHKMIADMVFNYLISKNIVPCQK